MLPPRVRNLESSLQRIKKSERSGKQCEPLASLSSISVPSLGKEGDARRSALKFPETTCLLEPESFPGVSRGLRLIVDGAGCSADPEHLAPRLARMAIHQRYTTVRF